jgi:hypothetical protein
MKNACKGAFYLPAEDRVKSVGSSIRKALAKEGRKRFRERHAVWPANNCMHSVRALSGDITAPNTSYQACAMRAAGERAR